MSDWFTGDEDAEGNKLTTVRADLACEMLGLLQQIVHPYGMYDAAVANTSGTRQDRFLETGSLIRAVIKKAEGRFGDDGGHWRVHSGPICSATPDTKIDAVIWREGGRHTWGIPFRADELPKRNWNSVAAFRVARP